MPANFPSNPTNNQTYVYNNIRWKFNGYSWQIDLETGLPIGATGATGPRGATGPGGGGGGSSLTVSNIQITDNTYTVTGESSADTARGYVVINGIGFISTPQVYIKDNAAPVVNFVSSTQLTAQLPPTPAGTYPLYVVNPDGSTAIGIPGVTFDSITWSSPTNNQALVIYNTYPINLQLSANSASGRSITYTANTLPIGLTITGSNITGTPNAYPTGGTVGTLLTATTAVTNKRSNIAVRWDISGVGYGITPSSTSISEGAVLTYTVNTTNVANGTTLYWTNSGTTDASDFSGGINSGSFVISATGAIGNANVSITTINENIYEGNETIIFEVRTGSTSGQVAATAPTVTLSDAAATYAINPNSNTVIEGNAVTYTVTTTSIQNGTVLYWTNSGTTVAADFVENTNSGTVTINNNTGSFTLNVVSVPAYEGNETIVIQLRTLSTSGTIVATAPTVTVTETTPTYAVSPSSLTINEGQTVTYTVTTGNLPGGTTLYWDNGGTATAADIGGSNSGSFTINSAGQGTVAITATLDSSTEGSETIILQIRTGSTSGTIVATAATVTIADTSLSPVIEYLVVAGGGGGGECGIQCISCVSGGGGAGGLLSGSFTASVQTLSVTVGGGGYTGSNSQLGPSILAVGGGRGGSYAGAPAGSSGGSGGGGGQAGGPYPGTPGQGNNGGGTQTGNGAGGSGGGAGAAGSVGGAGAVGTLFPAFQYWGTDASNLTAQLNGKGYFAGGGGAGNWNWGSGGSPGGGGGGGGRSDRGSGPFPGVANTGGGGGGAGADQNTPSRPSPATGGSGIVILRYLGGTKATGGTISSYDGYTYHVFTSSGSWSYTG